MAFYSNHFRNNFIFILIITLQSDEILGYPAEAFANANTDSIESPCVETSLHTVLCSGLRSPAALTNAALTARHLTVTNSSLVALSGEHLLPLTQLLALTITHSRVVLSDLVWPARLGLEELVLERCWSNSPDTNNSNGAVNNKLQKYLQIPPKVWSALTSLKTLKIVECSIKVDDEPGGDGAVGFGLLPPSTFLSIEGGEYECHSIQVYLLTLVESGRAAVSENTSCFILEDISKFNSYYTFNKKPLLDVLKLRKSVERCPSACSCELLGFRSLDRPLLSVDCRGAGLTTLPPAIPPLASSLIMSDNNLTNIDAVFSNPDYSRLAKCDFSNNAISSINGAALLNYFTSREHDVYFDLRNNKLSQFPVWELTSFYNKGHRSGEKHLPAFDLSGNPWDCEDCSFIPYFKSFVYDNMFHIPDHLRVRCDDTGALRPILYVDFEAQCYPKQSPLMAIDVVNIFMALVLLATIANFAHNYYQYRRYGKLPWVVRHCKRC
ncbi:protein singed wings 2 [Hyalella azteca]|uniref:Protein singed wings 2 n=1 Tax=Hyalella azteca TaxID=294128 RepID=A0A8B7NRJ1_HYAAZ|nr:protein singed wings 2 [Hyalella azteca]